MDWNDRVIEDWENSLINPPEPKEDDEWEEPDYWDMEDDEINEYTAVTDRLAKLFLKMGERTNA